MRYGDYRTPGQKRTARTFVEWIKTRSFESWGFFIAGFLIARIIF